MPDPFRSPREETDAGPPGMRCELLTNRSRGTDARSQPANASCEQQFTPTRLMLVPDRLSTQDSSCTEPADAVGLAVAAALNWRRAVGSADAELGADQRNPGGCGRRSAGLAVAPAAGRRPGIRRSLARLESRAPGCRP